MSDIWLFDPGYLPGDPRHGLSPTELANFYASRPAQWLIRSTYGADALAKRDGAMDAHVAYLSARKDQIRFVGPLLADDGLTPIGSWAMIDAADRADAEAFIADEGFVRAGMISDIEIKRFAETSLEDRRQSDMTPDPALQMYLCELIDGPEGAERRKGAGPAHHAFQKSVMDSFIARGPMRSDDGMRIIGTTYIIKVRDRAAAEDFIAAEPLAQAGVFSKIRIDRWRFGKSIA